MQASSDIHLFEKKGLRYRNFIVTKSMPIEELQCHLIELTHEGSGAKIMHIANNDPENVFCLAFRTLPNSSDGVAHILEHTVLCGSKKYPVRDPFFSMTRRSLNTYMNALTGADFTCYPAASQVKNDFYNLLDVYLDAVFHPLLKELSFLQEGHRLEFKEANDPSTPLEYKGIVYNEMKGSLSSPSSRLMEALGAALFPNNPYGYNSGGDPKNIPDLTYEQLVEFHKKYYHPSHCLFFFYGNFPLSQHLDYLEDNLFKHVKPAPDLEPIPLQTKLSQPVKQQLFYPLSDSEDAEEKALLAFGWLTCPILDQETTLALSILEVILMDNDASPLKQALLRSGLCKQVSSYLDTDMNEIPFGIILKGCTENAADKLEEVIHSTLQKLAIEGIPSHLIESALHQFEFFRSEITGDHYPFGLSLFFRAGLLKQHGGQAEYALQIHSLFDRLRSKMLDGTRYLPNLIITYLLNNPHRVRIEMLPDQELAFKEQKEEQHCLESIKCSLNEKQIQSIVSKAQELEVFQEQEDDDHNILPKVTLKDVPTTSKDYPLSHQHVGNIEVFHHSCFTNGIVYADLTFPMPNVKEQDLWLLRLFALLLPQVGSGGRNYQRNLEFIQENTGGVSASLSLNLQASDHNQFSPSFGIRGKALNYKSPRLFQLLYDMTLSADFQDKDRLKEVILKHFTALDTALNQSAVSYAINLSASALNLPSRICNAWYGLEYYWKIKSLVQNFDSRIDALAQDLETLKSHLLGNQGAHLILSCDETQFSKLMESSFEGVADIPLKGFHPWDNHFSLLTIEPQARLIASPVAFIATVIPTVPYIHSDSPALGVAANLFADQVLHRRIREQGGAYGGGASCNRMSGNFYFYSYRDPNITLTFDAFKESIEEILSGHFEERHLEEAKLKEIQAFDSPVSPGSRADVAYGWWRQGKTHAMRQAYRDKTLALTPSDIQSAVHKHIASNYDKGIPVVFAGKELIESENQKLIKENKQALKIEKI